MVLSVLVAPRVRQPSSERSDSGAQRSSKRSSRRCFLSLSLLLPWVLPNNESEPIPLTLPVAWVAIGHFRLYAAAPNLEPEYKMKINAAFLLVVITAISGCVQTAYSKSISVTKDADGRVVQTVETETVTQPGQGYQMKLEKIKGIQP